MYDEVAKTNWDLIVVGSGPSGGRIAYELAKKGLKVLLLEAGRHFKSEEFPKSELASSAQMFWGGGVELSTDAKFGFLRAKCVGGTSVVNQALLDRFDNLAWSEWQDISGIPFSDDLMEPFYLAVEQSLSIQYLERQHFNRNTQLFTKAFEQKGLKWAPLRRGQKDCALHRGTDCMACLGGCPRRSKQSTLVTSIEPGLQQGLQLLANCEVVSIRESVEGAVVSARYKSEGRTSELMLKARTVVLAGGSFGTTKILLQSEGAKKQPALGKGLSCHPQFMTYSYFDEPVDAFKGAFQAVKSDDDYLRRSGIKFENVFAPPIATAMLFDGFGRKHQQQMAKYRHLASMEIAIRDEATGSIAIDKKGKLLVKKELTDQDKSRSALGLKLVQEMYESLGAKEIVQCKQTFGLHLMGGCAIGTDSSKSVIDPEFRVHGSKRIFVADSSIFPSAPGINPSLTIMALSQKALPLIERSCS